MSTKGQPSTSFRLALTWVSVTAAVCLFVRAAVQAQAPAPTQATGNATAAYMGSAACRVCHASIYERWQRTRMANVVRDPKDHPDAIIPNLSVPNPCTTCHKDKSNTWAIDALKTWPEFSPWRVAR